MGRWDVLRVGRVLGGSSWIRVGSGSGFYYVVKKFRGLRVWDVVIK